MLRGKKWKLENKKEKLKLIAKECKFVAEKQTPLMVIAIPTTMRIMKLMKQ